MRAVVFRAPGVIDVVERDEPHVVDPADAIVRVTRAGICGSDLHFFHGKAPIEPGTTMGHEAAGVVTEIGDDVRTVAVGDRVVTSFHIACGACWFCRSGRSGLCDEHRILGGGPFGGELEGTQAGAVRVPVADVNLLRVPEGVDDERALFVGDALTTAVYAVSLVDPDPSETIAIVGAGPVGSCVAMVLRAHGAEHVFALDLDRARLDLVAQLGATAVDVASLNAEMALARVTDGRGADVVVDAVGAPGAFASSLETVRRGGRVVVVGVYTSEVVELQLGVSWVRGIQLLFAGETPIHAWWGSTMDAVAAGDLDPLPLISHRLSIDEAPAGYAAFDTRAATKVVLDPWA